MPKSPGFFKKHAAVIIIVFLLVVGIAAALAVGEKDTQKKTPAAVTMKDCGPYRKDGIMTINNQQINVEIAYTAAEKTKGLAGRPCIDANQGMIFDFSKDGQYGMWMKGMEFPIDLVWINSYHQIVYAIENVQPSSYKTKQVFVNDSNHLARYVLELKANKLQELKIGKSTTVHFQKV